MGRLFQLACFFFSAVCLLRFCKSTVASPKKCKQVRAFLSLTAQWQLVLPVLYQSCGDFLSFQHWKNWSKNLKELLTWGTNSFRPSLSWGRQLIFGVTALNYHNNLSAFILQVVWKNTRLVHLFLPLYSEHGGVFLVNYCNFRVKLRQFTPLQLSLQLFCLIMILYKLNLKKRKGWQNEIKGEPEQIEGEEGAVELLPKESHATASLISKCCLLQL